MSRVVSVVVPTFHRPATLRRALDSLFRLEPCGRELEVVVVDDGGDDEAEAVVGSFAAAGAAVRYLRQQNLGVATARNRGAAAARGDVIVFSDDDILVKPGNLRIQLEHLEERAPCAVNGHWEFEPALLAELESTPFGRFRLDVERWVKTAIDKQPASGGVEEPSAVTACNLAIRRVDFDRIGGFDEQFPFAGAEDQEFSVRARAGGIRFVYDRRIELLHEDHRLDLRAFCERQWRGAVTSALLSLKYPDLYGARPLVVANRELRRADPPPVMARKLVKAAVATKPSREVVHRVVAGLERIGAPAAVLHRLYWTACGLYIFGGFREGLRRFRGQVAPPVAASGGHDCRG